MSEIKKKYTLFRKSAGGWGVFDADGHDQIIGIDDQGDLWGRPGCMLHEQLFEIAEFIKEHCNPRWTPDGPIRET